MGGATSSGAEDGNGGFAALLDNPAAMPLGRERCDTFATVASPRFESDFGTERAPAARIGVNACLSPDFNSASAPGTLARAAGTAGRGAAAIAGKIPAPDSSTATIGKQRANGVDKPLMRDAFTSKQASRQAPILIDDHAPSITG
jgi:hypothetical protein